MYLFRGYTLGFALSSRIILLLLLTKYCKVAFGDAELVFGDAENVAEVAARHASDVQNHPPLRTSTDKVNLSRASKTKKKQKSSKIIKNIFDFRQNELASTRSWQLQVCIWFSLVTGYTARANRQLV